jgi:hypothetical protein
VEVEKYVSKKKREELNSNVHMYLSPAGKGEGKSEVTSPAKTQESFYRLGRMNRSQELS